MGHYHYLVLGPQWLHMWLWVVRNLQPIEMTGRMENGSILGTGRMESGNILGTGRMEKRSILQTCQKRSILGTGPMEKRSILWTGRMEKRSILGTGRLEKRNILGRMEDGRILGTGRMEMTGPHVAMNRMTITNSSKKKSLKRPRRFCAVKSLSRPPRRSCNSIVLGRFGNIIVVSQFSNPSNAREGIGSKHPEQDGAAKQPPSVQRWEMQSWMTRAVPSTSKSFVTPRQGAAMSFNAGEQYGS